MLRPVNFLPDPTLSKYIFHYGVLEVPEGKAESYFSPPLALSGFIIQTINTSKEILCKIGDRDFFTTDAVVTGQVTYPITGQLTGEVKTIMVFFQPLGIYRLFGMDMEQLTNKSITLQDFLTPEIAEQLISDLQADESSEVQIEVMNRYFSGLKPKKQDCEKLSRVLDFIHSKNGGVSIKEIEDFGFYHRKTLERHFKKMVGLSPKVYLKVYQFKCLLNLLQMNPAITWTQLADQAGYYDQAHMSRYVKEYLKVSPNSIVSLDMPFINYLLS